MSDQIKIDFENTIKTNNFSSEDIESKKYLKGTLIEVWAMPFDGYKFVGWSGSYDSTKNPLLITVDSEKEVIAIFSK